MPLVERSFRDLLAAFASSDPTPGGGSAAAATAGIGASLLMMVAGLPKTRTGSEAERTALTSALIAMKRLQAQLTDAVDADTAAYNQVVAAYRQPKGTPPEQASRKAAIQRALHAATDVPLNVMRLSAESLRHARTIAADAHRPAASDVGVAVALLNAGLHGARLNVETNISSLSDAAYKDAVAAEIDRLVRDGRESADVAQASLGSSLG